MYGLISYRSAGAPPVRVIGGVPLRTVYVTEGRSLHAVLSARFAAAALRRSSVRLAAFPPGYPYCNVFARRGVEAPSPAPLYRASAAAIVRRFAAQRGMDLRSAAVVFAAESVTPELRRCVEALCAEVRYVALAAPHGGEALARTLRQRFGVTAPCVSAGGSLQAALTVVFDETPARGEVLRLDGTLRALYDSPYPTDVLGLLWRAGALDAAALRVKEVTVPKADAGRQLPRNSRDPA